MGIFEKLFGGVSKTRKKTLNVLLYETTQGKLDGIEKAISEPFEGQTRDSFVSTVVLVAHFSDTHQRLHAIAKKGGFPTPVEVVLAEEFWNRFENEPSFDDSRSLEIIIAEKHPSIIPDDQLEKAIKELPFPTRHRYYLSNEDAVMKIFAGPFVRRMLSAAGFSDAEPVESQMVEHRIRNFQTKVARLVVNPESADSDHAWMAHNVGEQIKSRM